MYILHVACHSFINVQLGCFYLLAVVNNVANKWVCKYLFESLPSVLLRINPEVELLEYMVILGRIVFRNCLTVFLSGLTIKGVF